MKGITENKIDALDDKFWVWETLEEATRPDVQSLSNDELVQFHRGWLTQAKGSSELFDISVAKLFANNALGPPFFNNYAKDH